MNRLGALLAVSLVVAVCGCSSSTGGMKPSSDSSQTANAGAANSANKKGGEGSQNSSVRQDTIAVTPEQQRVDGILIGKVEPRAVARTLTVPGQITMDEERTAHIASYPDGKVVDVLRLQGDFVHAGDVLAHLHSHAVHETVGALAQDFANLARQQSSVVYATAKRDRYAHLYAIQAASLEQQQTSQQELVQAQTMLEDAQATVTMEREHLGDLLQVQPASITPATLYDREQVPLTTPITGTVISRSITPGMVLEPGVEAYTVSNLGMVWLIAAVNEVDLPYLRLGQRVSVHSRAWPQQEFAGRVTLIGSMLDPATRTVQVRVSLPNPKTELRPQMFATATIDETATQQAIFIPETAVQQLNGVQVAFVTTDGSNFTPHALEVLPATGGQVQVTQGLKAGDSIATVGSFMLKSALIKSASDAE